MAFPAKNYAEALFYTLEVTPQKEALPKIAKNFIKLLKKHHRYEDLPLILEYLKKLYFQSEKHSLNASVEYAGLNPEKELERLLRAQNPQKEIHIKSQENPSLIGGSRLQVKDLFLDLSIESTLNRFLNQLT